MPAYQDTLKLLPKFLWHRVILSLKQQTASSVVPLLTTNNNTHHIRILGSITSELWLYFLFQILRMTSAMVYPAPGGNGFIRTFETNTFALAYKKFNKKLATLASRRCVVNHKLLLTISYRQLAAAGKGSRPASMCELTNFIVLQSYVVFENQNFRQIVN